MPSSDAIRLLEFTHWAIDSPGAAAIAAVLHPPKGNWTFFVTIDPKTGRTGFTNSAAQFNKWVKESDQNIKNGT